MAEMSWGFHNRTEVAERNTPQGGQKPCRVTPQRSSTANKAQNSPKRTTSHSLTPAREPGVG